MYSTSHDLVELLAVIHSDGGHYTARHGQSKSARDAHAVISELRTRLDKAEFDLQKMHHRWDGHDCYPRNGND